AAGAGDVGRADGARVHRHAARARRARRLTAGAGEDRSLAAGDAEEQDRSQDAHGREDTAPGRFSRGRRRVSVGAHEEPRMTSSSSTTHASTRSVTGASGDALNIRERSVHEAMSSLFSIPLTAVSENHDIDFEAVVGKEASFTLHGRAGGATKPRTWTGVC